MFRELTKFKNKAFKRGTRPRMDTRFKLEEARYFLEELVRTQNDPKQSYFYLSAFLSAWRSVPDVMLYDFAEHYSIGLTREDKMWPHDYWIVAKAQQNAQALAFYKEWWTKKIRELKKNPLWNTRHILVHRGYPEITHTVYVPISISAKATAYTVFPSGSEDEASDIISSIVHGEKVQHEGSPVIHMVMGPPAPGIKFPDLLDECKKAFDQMEKFVNETENKFNIKL